ncbi:MAG: transcription repressor NadR [Eubacteriales bacterium]|nr:transcription repressor NadR [Eubacteriales bacterium]
MDASIRRNQMLELLRKSDRPISAASLAGTYHVSRQIIVGDIALLRAAGNEIEATARGYMIPAASAQLRRRIACRHQSEQMREELYAIVDNGCTVIDVIVEHPLYGQLTGMLQLSNRYEVDQFVEKSLKTEAIPLSFLTEGIHIHTISCPTEEAGDRVESALKEMGVLLT